MQYMKRPTADRQVQTNTNHNTYKVLFKRLARKESCV